MWTKEMPKASGFYWYKDPERAPEIVEVSIPALWHDDAPGDMAYCGNEIRGRLDELDGEFWSVPVVAPKIN